MTLPPPRAGFREPARLRRFLAGAGFHEAGVTERLELSSLFAFRTLRGGRTSATTPTDRLGLLIHLFMDGEPAPEAEARRLLGEEGLGLLQEAGLLLPDPHEPSTLAAAALLYPVGPLLIASDVNEQAPGASPDGGALRPDAVYPALTGAVRGFLRDLPDPTEVSADARVLDLCAGTGVAGLLLASRAGEVVLADLTERCSHFARFNAALNEVGNVRVAQGDLWEAVADERFDVVVAHPPYVPSETDQLIFRDAGIDGERLFRGVVAGAPQHLNPGGLLYVRGTAVDRVDAPVESRLRAMLGEAHGDFDVFVAISDLHSPEEYLSRASGAASEAGVDRLSRARRLREGGVAAFVHGTFLVQRREAPREVATVRRVRAPTAGRRALDWMRRSEVQALRPHAPRELLRRLPRLREGVEMEVRYRMEEGELRNRGCRVGVDTPFRVAVDLPAGASRFLPLFSGRRHTLRVLEEGVKRGMIPPGTPPDQFAGLAQALILAGILEIEGAEPPPPEA
ncbi:MAG: methyltransferase domain-containing protein [Gemmatimonadales bacterium]|nr:MAG: methyltransferase domain-containing protein [Gemmatimonadales bacterium]